MIIVAVPMHRNARLGSEVSRYRLQRHVDTDGAPDDVIGVPVECHDGPRGMDRFGADKVECGVARFISFIGLAGLGVT